VTERAFSLVPFAFTPLPCLSAISFCIEVGVLADRYTKFLAERFEFSQTYKFFHRGSSFCILRGWSELFLATFFSLLLTAFLTSSGLVSENSSYNLEHFISQLSLQTAH
jgi:hypothetical protein